MKVLFAHDHFFVREGASFFSSTGSFTNSVVERYTNVFDNVLFLTRKKKLSEAQQSQRLSPIRVNNVSFKEVPDFKSLATYHRISEAKKIIGAAVQSADCLIARLPSSIGSTAIHYAQKYGKPYLIELVGCPWDALWNYGSFLAKTLAPLSYLRTKRLVRNSRFVIYVTNSFLQLRYPTKGKWISCSNVSIPDEDNGILQDRLQRIRSGQKNSSIILGTAAAVGVRYKGQQYVIKALSQLAKLGYKMEYHLAGSGSREFLSSVAKKFGVMDKVKFVGSVPREKILDYFDSIDIYIQPSKQEGLPRALIEAMSRGCPAIGSMTGGIPELLDSEFIFRNGSVSDIVRKIRSFDMGKMEQQAKINFEKAKEYHRDVLEKRRESFLTEFKRSIEEF